MHDNPPGSCRALRFTIPVLATLLLGLFALLYAEQAELYFRILYGWGVSPFTAPFIDLHSVLASIECKRLGYQVFVGTPCDLFIYSPFILEAAIWPISVTQTMAAGLALSLAFFAALATLPLPQGRFGWILTILATVSTMTAFAVERGNIDLFIFIIVATAGHLALRTGAARWLAYPLILFGALLKFYPVTLLILALREKPRALAAMAAGSLGLIAVFGFVYRASLAMAFQNTPSGSYFTNLFGALNLPRGLADALTPLVDRNPAAAPALAALPWAVMGLLVLFSLGQAISILPMMRTRVPTLAPLPAIFLISGATLIVFCFFAGQNVDYRGIFFLFVIPALSLLARQEPFFARAAIAILFLMWGEFFRNRIMLTEISSAIVAFWLIRELIWWHVIGMLMGVLIQFAITSEIGTTLLLRVTRLRKRGDAIVRRLCQSRLFANEPR